MAAIAHREEHNYKIEKFDVIKVVEFGEDILQDVEDVHWEVINGEEENNYSKHLYQLQRKKRAKEMIKI